MKRRHVGPGVAVAIAFGALIAGCSGGGGSQAPAAPQAAINSSTTPGTTGVQPPNSAAVTISVRMPQKKATTAQRSPAYVSPATSSITVTALPSNTTASIKCSQGLCTGTFFAPLTTTSLSVQLSDAKAHVLSQSSQNVSLTPGQTNSFTFTFDGVVQQFAVAAGASALVIAAPTSFPITITPTDYDNNPIVAPGNVIDPSGNVLISADGSTQTVSLLVNPAGAVTIGALTWNPGSYTLTGIATFGGVDPGQPVTLTPSTTVDGTIAGVLTLPVQVKSLFVVPTSNYAPPAAVGAPGLPAYQVVTGSAGPTTTTSVEFGVYPTPAPVAVGLTVTANFNDAGAALTLGPDTCTGPSYVSDGSLLNSFPSAAPTMPTGNSYTFVVNASAPTPAVPPVNTQCSFTVTDAANSISATTTFGFNNPTIYVQGKGRK